MINGCLLYTSDAADDTPCVDLGGRRIIKKNNKLILNSTYPSGTEVEMMSFNALEIAWKDAKTSDEREHVTPHIYLNPEKFRIKILHLNSNLSSLRWSLDYERDLKVIREIIQNIPHRPILMDDIIKFLNENPTVRDYNQHSN